MFATSPPPSYPRPVYPPDTPLRDLATAELFVVCSLRLWVLAYRDPEGETTDWRRGFVHAGIDVAGANGFDALFRIVAAMARRSLDVRCPLAAHLGRDEAWLLRLVSLLQRLRIAESEAILGDWLPPGAARGALAPAQKFAWALAASGLPVPLRHCEAASLERLTPMAHGARGLALVH